MLPAAFDWSRAAIVSRRHLPHMRQPGAVYFVTYRTADSVPADLVVQWNEQIAISSVSGDEARANALARRVEKYLDNPTGDCPLAVPEHSQVVCDNLLHGDGRRYLLDAYVIMPNHVHVLVMPRLGEDLARITADWKRFSARIINKMRRSTGSVWAAESFDHIVRDAAALARFRAYITANPAKVPHIHTRLGHGSFTQQTGL